MLIFDLKTNPESVEEIDPSSCSFTKEMVQNPEHSKDSVLSSSETGATDSREKNSMI